VKGFDDGGYNVFEKRARLAENLLPHDFIVTGGLGLWPGMACATSTPPNCCEKCRLGHG
jgi:hypothetical protein